MGSFFFSPSGRMSVSRPLATAMNTLNVLAPALLLVAVAIALIGKFGGISLELRQLMTKYSAILIVTALLIRIIWGFSIRIIQRRSQNNKS